MCEVRAPADMQQLADPLVDSLQPVGELQALDEQESFRQHDRTLDIGASSQFHDKARDSEWRDTGMLPLEPVVAATRPQYGRKRKRSHDHGRLQPPRLPTLDSGDAGDEDDDDEDDDYDGNLDDDADDVEEIPPPHPTANHAVANGAEISENTLERTIVESDTSPMALPANQVFPIQVGSKLFRLSGASISSDAPSYFTQFFQAQLQRGIDAADIRTLYLDRDPATFRDISLHLQGYHVEALDSTHFVRLFADAQFFSLPRLIQRLYKSHTFVRIGDEEFKISRDIFDGPGNTPNYFSLGFSAFFSTPDNVFPGLHNDSLLRPPSIKPPHIPTKSSAVFRELLTLLEGYEIHIRDEEHRLALLKDAQYYHLKGLEQKLVAHQILYNVHRKKTEIIMRLSDLKATGISLKTAAQSSKESSSAEDAFALRAPSSAFDVAYIRPFTDGEPLSLIFELGPSDLILQCSFDRSGNTIVLCASSRARILKLYKIIRSKVTETAGVDSVELPQALPQAVIERDAHVVLDGRTIDWVNVERGDNDLSKLWIASLAEPPEDEDAAAREQETWIVNRSQWRLLVGFVREPQPAIDITWRAVKIDAVSSEAQWNAQRGFL